MDSAIVTALLAGGGILGGIATRLIERYRTRQERQATEATLAASAAAAVRDVYGEIIDDLQAQVAAARADAKASRDAARESQRSAEEAEQNAWRAEGWAREMQRFLAEVRPLIEAYVPDAQAWLARLDRLAGITKPTNPTP